MRLIKTTFALLAVVVGACAALAGPDSSPLHKVSLAQTMHNKTRILIAKSRKEQFPLTESLSKDGWFQVDLSPAANRSTYAGGTRGWLGLRAPHDLRRLKPGPHTFYGVPLRISDSKKGTKPNCLALASQHISINEAPEKLSVEVGRKAQVLYILGACGWSTMKQNFEVVAHFSDGSADKFQINPAGVLRGQYENIHEWSHSDDVIETPVSRPIVLPLNETPQGITDTRTIYILQWRVSNPEKVIDRLEFIGDKNYNATLLILAITGHP